MSLSTLTAHCVAPPSQSHETPYYPSNYIVVSVSQWPPDAINTIVQGHIILSTQYA
jgi:hypothetical protein